jgi:hypothetical protein
MQANATATPDRLSGKHSFRDGYMRAACCGIIGVLGFWSPLLAIRHFGPDPQLGINAVLSLPFVVVFAFRATDSLCCAYEDAPKVNRRRRLPFIAAIVFFCWLPVLLWTCMMVGGLVRAYVR